MRWRWISLETCLEIHSRQINEHGGQSGLRDEGLLQSALARPINLALYESPTIVDLSAAYGYGIISNHPFIDGNKRTGFVVAVTFVLINGAEFDAETEDIVSTFQGVASGQIDEQILKTWFASRIT